METRTWRRVLVVDDEENLAQTLGEGLRALPGIEVDVATSSAVALELFCRQPYHLLVTDYRMPELDGLTLAHRARLLCPMCQVILISAYYEPHLVSEATRLSIKHVLAKPVSLAALRLLVLSLLGNEKRGQAHA